MDPSIIRATKTIQDTIGIHNEAYIANLIEGKQRTDVSKSKSIQHKINTSN